MTARGALTAADLRLHETLGIDPDVLVRAQARRVTDADARDLGVSGHGDMSGIAYLFVDPATDRAVTCSVRRDRPEIENGKPTRKYMTPYGDRPHLYLSGARHEDFPEIDVPVVLVESPKAALMIRSIAERTSRPLLPVGMGGCWGWRGRIGRTEAPDGARTDEIGPLPDLNRIAWADRDAIIWLDADVTINTQVAAAQRALVADLTRRGARVRIARAPDASDTEGPDDYRARTDDAAVLAVLAGAYPAAISCDTVGDHLRVADLDALVEGIVPADLEGRLRRLGDSVRGVDALRRRLVRESAIGALKAAKVAGAAGLVDAAMGGGEPATADDPSSLPDDPPADAPVTLAPLLDELAETIRRYVVLSSSAAADAIALWIVMAWAEASISIMPILSIVSPTPRCGKSTTITVIGALAPRALLVSGITPAALFRSVEAWHPTLIVDEADTVLPGNEDLRGVLNAGHTRHAAVVIRCVGDDQTPTRFSVWCPKVLALIGRPPTTVLDRSILIELRRKTPADPPVARLRQDTIQDELRGLRRACRRWTDDHGAALRRADPDLPATLHDRAADNWRALVAIADVAGEGWPERARTAACEISGVDDEADQPLGVLALADIRDVWPAGSEHVASSSLVDLLLGVEDRPWKALGRADRPLTGVGLARLLRPFRVRTQKLKRHGKTANVYVWTELDEAITRYVPPTHSEPRNPPTARRRNQRSNSEPVPDAGSESQTRNHLQRVARFRGSESDQGIAAATAECDASEDCGGQHVANF